MRISPSYMAAFQLTVGLHLWGLSYLEIGVWWHPQTILLPPPFFHYTCCEPSRTESPMIRSNFVSCSAVPLSWCTPLRYSHSVCPSGSKWDESQSADTHKKMSAAFGSGGISTSSFLGVGATLIALSGLCVSTRFLIHDRAGRLIVADCEQTSQQPVPLKRSSC